MRFQGKTLCDWCGNPVAGKKTQIKKKVKGVSKIFCDKHCVAAQKKYGSVA